SRVDGVRRERRIVGLAENGFDVAEALFPGAVLDVSDGLGIDVNGVDCAGAGDAAGGAHGEPSGAGTDVGDVLSRTEAKGVHDAVNLKPLVASGRIENRQVAGVRVAGLARGLGSVRLEGEDSGNAE